MTDLYLSDLQARKNCVKRRKFKALRLKGLDNTASMKARAMKNCLSDYFNGSINYSDIESSLKKSFSEINFISEEQRDAVFYSSYNALADYVFAEEAAKSMRTRLTPRGREIDIYGSTVLVIPDEVTYIPSESRFEVLKFSFKATPMPQTSFTGEGVNSSLEVYAMWKYAKELADEAHIEEAICTAGYVYISEKAISSSENIFELYSITGKRRNAYRVLSMPANEAAIVDNVYKKAWLDFSKDKCEDEANCQFCEFYNSCHFNSAPITEKIKTSKVLKDVVLTSEQEAAIDFETGAARIKAGAGAGKTLVITMRIINMIMKGYDPSKMLMITFTVNGAEEMRQRIKALCDDFTLPEENADKITISTFNGFAMSEVVDSYKLLGFSKKPEVIDSTKRKSIILESIAGTILPNINYASFENTFGKDEFSKIIAVFDFLKRERIHDYNWKDPANYDVIKKAPLPITQEWIDVFTKYETRLKQENMVEYADQEALLDEILTANPYYLEDKFSFENIIIDEYQDSDSKQLSLIKKMIDSPYFNSLMVVGDDSQNIFEGLRGTSIDNIVDFAALIDMDVENFELMENHRSTPEIIRVANNINRKREYGIAADIIPVRPSGAPVVLKAFESTEDERSFIADDIKKRIDSGIKPDTICFIAYTRDELKDMAEKLAKRGIPSWMLTPEKVRENSRVIAAVALSEFMEDTTRSGSAFDYLNTISEGRLLEVLSVEEINEKIAAFKAEIDSKKQETELLELYKEYIETLDASDEVFAQYKEKVLAQKTFGEVLSYGRTLMRFGQNEDVRRKAYAGSGVVLTTVHSSKGLEWSEVYVSTSHFSKKATKPDEEKRRVLFTAVTRARDYLTITGQFEKPTLTVNTEKGKKKASKTTSNFKSFFIEELFADEGIERDKIVPVPDSHKSDKKDESVIAEVKKIMERYAPAKGSRSD